MCIGAAAIDAMLWRQHLQICIQDYDWMPHNILSPWTTKQAGQFTALWVSYMATQLGRLHYHLYTSSRYCRVQRTCRRWWGCPSPDVQVSQSLGFQVLHDISLRELHSSGNPCLLSKLQTAKQRVYELQVYVYPHVREAGGTCRWIHSIIYQQFRMSKVGRVPYWKAKQSQNYIWNASSMQHPPTYIRDVLYDHPGAVVAGEVLIGKSGSSFNPGSFSTSLQQPAALQLLVPSHKTYLGVPIIRFEPHKGESCNAVLRHCNCQCEDLCQICKLSSNLQIHLL